MKTCGLVRLTGDPEIRYSQGEKSFAIARFSVAEEIFPKPKNADAPTANFYNVTAFRGLAETVEKYLRKGSQIYLFGDIVNNNYTDKDGVKHYGMQIVANEIRFCSGNPNKGNGTNENQESDPAPAPASDDGFMNIPEGIDEELPFN